MILFYAQGIELSHKIRMSDDDFGLAQALGFIYKLALTRAANHITSAVFNYLAPTRVQLEVGCEFVPSADFVSDTDNHLFRFVDYVLRIMIGCSSSRELCKPAC